MDLRTAVQMWRTPNTMDGMEPKSQEALEHELEHRPGRAEPNNLRDQVAVQEGLRMWPTPRAESGVSRKPGTGGKCLQEEARKAMGANTGALNATWVEWLMGYPLGWTNPKECQESSKGKKTG
jgi:hypothetical protein